MKSNKVVMRGLIIGILATIIGQSIGVYLVTPSGTVSFLGAIRISAFLGALGTSLVCLPFTATIPITMSLLGQKLIKRIQKDDLYEATWGWLGATAGGILGSALIIIFFIATGG